METQRNLLTISLFVICTILYFKWIDFTTLRKVSDAPTQVVSEVPSVEREMDNLPTDDSSVPIANNLEIPQEEELTEPNSLITVTTDMVIAKINTKGGTIERLELRQHPADIEDPELGFALLKNEAGETFVAEDGLSHKDKQAPNHVKQYQSAGSSYELGSGDSITVPLTWVSESGVKFIKTITFQRDSYVVSINYQIDNASNSNWQGKLYGQFNRTEPTSSGGGFGQLPSYTGAAIYEPNEKYQKIDFDEIVDRDEDERRRNRSKDAIAKNSLLTQSGWVAMMQHYFVGYRAGFTSEFLTVEPGQSGNIGTRIYLGPKETKRLNKLEEEEKIEGVHLTVDYGFLTFIADPNFLSFIGSQLSLYG